MKSLASLRNAQNEGVELDPAQMRDVNTIYASHPVLRAGRDAFVNMILKCPPTISLQSMPHVISDELRLLMEHKWVRWAQNVYDWLKLIGVCPYYLERLPQTIHRYPVVPVWGSGTIRTHLDKRGHQQFTWYDRNVVGMNEPRKNMLWWHESDHALPMLNGTLRSNVATLLSDWRLRNVLSEAVAVAQYQAARPQHIFEYSPPKANQVGDNMSTLNSFGEDIAGLVMSQTEGLRKRKIRIRTDELRRAMAETFVANQHRARVDTGAYGATDKPEDAWERANAGFLDRSIRLPPDFSYKAAATPKVVGDPAFVSKRLDQQASNIIDFPLELVQSGGSQKAANLQGNLRYWNERIKYWLSHFERAYKHVLLQVYGQVIQEGLEAFHRFRTQKSFRQQLELDAKVALIVEMPCTPIVHYAALKELYTDGLLSKETLARHTFHMYGLPESDMELREVDTPTGRGTKRPRGAKQEIITEGTVED